MLKLSSLALGKQARGRQGVSACCLLLGLILLPLFASAQATVQASSRANELYQQALQLRLSLDAEPAGARTKAQYEQVLQAYRAVYEIDPTSDKADASAFAVGHLLAQYGELFHEPAISQKAITQDDFLARQYPNSPYREPALLDQGILYSHDLGNTTAARAAWQQLITRYPSSRYAEQARRLLSALNARQGIAEPPAQSHYQESRSEQRGQSQAQLQPEQPRQPVAEPAPRALEQASPNTQQFHAQADLPVITGIRHWSTPDYTRVAITLQQKVAYQAYRVPGSGQIDFNFFGARFAQALRDHSIAVVDTGFLKHIQLTQDPGGLARIELDVSPFSEYYAFYLPNPPRLIIDVHGHAATARSASAAMPPDSASSPSKVTVRPLRAYAEPVGRRSRSADGAPLESRLARRSDAQAGLAWHGVQPKPTTGPVESEAPAATAAGTATVDRASADEYPYAAGSSSSARSRARPRRERALASAALPEPLTNLRSGVVGHPAIAPPLSASNPSLIRALGLKITRIVLDPGHGGHDSGAIGPDGLEEKNVALDVALRLGRLLHQRLGIAVVYTRDNDTFIPLETRTAIANQDHADLFMSIHVNSSPDSSARGVATYYLSFTTSADALELAARENAVSNQSIYQLSNLVKKIELSNKISESRVFADDVQQSLYGSMKLGNGPGFEDRGVRKAPFVVLIGANMPSILTEISFISNPESEHLLGEPAYRERIAEALYRGVAQYIRTINGNSLNGDSANGASQLNSNQPSDSDGASSPGEP